MSADETSLSSPSPPGKISDLRSLKRGRIRSEDMKEVPPPSDFHILPVRISDVKYSSLAGQSEVSDGKSGEFLLRNKHSEELFPSKERLESRESTPFSLSPERKYMDMMGKIKEEYQEQSPKESNPAGLHSTNKQSASLFKKSKEKEKKV